MYSRRTFEVGLSAYERQNEARRMVSRRSKQKGADEDGDERSKVDVTPYPMSSYTLFGRVAGYMRTLEAGMKGTAE